MQQDNKQKESQGKGKKEYVKPDVRSQKVLEKAALSCDGVFFNSLYNLKGTYYTCGYNSS